MIHLSQAAISEVSRLKARRNNPQLLFRLDVQPSACLTMAYAMSFDTAVQPHDQVYDCNGIQVVVDSSSVPILEGLVLDYSEDLMGGGFRFHNPNAIQTCGCGNSFSVTDDIVKECRGN